MPQNRDYVTEGARPFEFDQGEEYCYDEASDCIHHKRGYCELLENTIFTDCNGTRKPCSFYSSKHYKPVAIKSKKHQLSKKDKAKRLEEEVAIVYQEHEDFGGDLTYKEIDKKHFWHSGRAYYLAKRYIIADESQIEAVRKRNREYWNKNREKILDQHKQYNEEHRAERKKYDKQYRESHKEERKEYLKKYRERKKNGN